MYDEFKLVSVAKVLSKH